MGSIEIFSESLYISISFWTLALLLFVSIYSSFNLNINKAVWYLFAGIISAITIPPEFPSAFWWQ